MEKLIAGAFVAVVFVVVIFLVAPLGALVGTFVGWFVGWLFPETMGMLASRVLWDGAAPWQLGLSAGFVAGFLNVWKWKS